MEPPSPSHRPYPIIQRRGARSSNWYRLGAALVIGFVLIAGIVLGMQRLTSQGSTGDSSLGPVEQAQATEAAHATQTAAAEAYPTPTIVIPPQAQAGASPSWQTLAELGPTGAGASVSGKFLVRAGAKARLNWTCTSAVGGVAAASDGMTFACTADLLNAETGKRVSTLADVSATGQGTYTFSASATDALYAIRISEQNTNFTALYQVYQ